MMIWERVKPKKATKLQILAVQTIRDSLYETWVEDRDTMSLSDAYSLIIKFNEIQTWLHKIDGKLLSNYFIQFGLGRYS